MNPDLRVRLGALELPNPVLAASGCAGTGRELAPFFDVGRIGAVATKSVMLEPRAGNPAPRMAETPSGMVSAGGLQGPGIDVLLQRDLPWLLSQGGRAVVSIAGSSTAEFAELARRLAQEPGVSAIEVNLSSPNLADRGRHFVHEPEAAAGVVAAVRGNADPGVPVLAKLSADAGDLVALAAACVDARADGLSMINTVRGLAIDTRAQRLAVAGGGEHSGLSGPAVRPIALACVYDVYAAFPEIPIVGVGGVRSGVDVVEFMLAGASAVAVGTVIFHDPSACVRILREFEEALEERGVDRAEELIGAAHESTSAGQGR